MRPGALGSAGSIGGYGGPNPDGPFAPSLSLVVVTSRLGSRKEGRVREPISDIPAISSWYTSGPGSIVARSTTTERSGDEATTMVPGGLPSILGGSSLLGLSFGAALGWSSCYVLNPSFRSAGQDYPGGRTSRLPSDRTESQVVQADPAHRSHCKPVGTPPLGGRDGGGERGAPRASPAEACSPADFNLVRMGQ